LAELDDKDLKLEVQRWKAEYAQLLQEKRKALASFDRAEIALIDAKLEQARAQVDLTTTKLGRTRIEAPIDGVVISGDLSQKLGTPVQQGVVLFEIAPLSSYRVILKLDERDIRHVEIGQSGHLLLSGRVEEALPFKVSKITSVSSIEDGRNLFKAEGLLDEAIVGIRPGMEGVGKVDVDDRPLISIWTRRLNDWARLFFWRWMP
jgi:multidrug resistance efflux pump